MQEKERGRGWGKPGGDTLSSSSVGPYVQMNMNPLTMPESASLGGLPMSAVRPLLYKDAMFVSPHKFIGGPGASGVLVAKKRLFANDVPSGEGSYYPLVVVLLQQCDCAAATT